MITMKDRIPVCPHGTREMIDQSLILALGRLEGDQWVELTFRSGFRCTACNAKAGGVKNSAHLRGLAVDIVVDNSGERFAVVGAAVRVGFFRIGIGRGFVHLDVDTSLPQQMMWMY